MAAVEAEPPAAIRFAAGDVVAGVVAAAVDMKGETDRGVIVYRLRAAQHVDEDIHRADTLIERAALEP